MTDSELKAMGVDILFDKLGIVEAERFISILLRQPFDYTAWRQTAFGGESFQELYSHAAHEWNEKEPSKDA